jgi:hypothetical protein
MRLSMISLFLLVTGCTTIQPIEITKVTYVHRVVPPELVEVPPKVVLPGAETGFKGITQKNVASFIYQMEQRQTVLELHLQDIRDWSDEPPPEPTSSEVKLKPYTKWFWEK